MLQTVVGGLLLIVSQLLTAVVLVLRFLPQLLGLAIFLLRAFVAASCLLYRAILVRAVSITARTGFDLLSGWRRLAACVLLSLVFGAIAFAILQWVITPLAIGIFIGHGVLVHLVWDQLATPTGLHMGV